MRGHRSIEHPGTTKPLLPSVMVVMALIALLLIIATVVSFWPGLHNQFLNWDDDRNFLENTHFRGLGAPQLRWAWETYHLGVWQPLSWMLLGWQYTRAGLDAGFYHGVSLALHCINAVVFFLMTVLLLRGGDEKSFQQRPFRAILCAGTCAMLFAVHPLRVEVVAWISSQPYLPAALFFMLAICAYLWGHRSGKLSRKPWLWLAVTFVCYLLAVGFKAVAVSLPAILLILDVYPLRRFSGHGPSFGRRLTTLVLEKLPFFAVAVLISLWAAGAKDFNASRVPFRYFDADARIAQSAYGLWFYPVKTVVPTGLIPYYKLPRDLSLMHGPYGAAAVGVALLTLGLFLLRRRFPAGLASWMAYCVILLPNLGLIQISQQIAADRYSYVAIMPLLIGTAAGMFYFWNRGVHHRRVALSGTAAAVIIVVMGLIIASNRQVRIWHDSQTLWRETLRVDPASVVAECELGSALVMTGDLEQGAAHFRSAIQRAPDFSFAHANLGAILLAKDRLPEAVNEFESALKKTALGAEDQAKTHAGLGAAYAGLGRYELAWKHTRTAQQLGFSNEKSNKMIRALQRVSQEPGETHHPAERAGGD